MAKFLNSSQAKAEAEAEQAEIEQQAVIQVNDLRQALSNMKEMLDATSAALTEAYATIQSQAVEIAMLERRLARRLMQEVGIDRTDGQ